MPATSDYELTHICFFSQEIELLRKVLDSNSLTTPTPPTIHQHGSPYDLTFMNLRSVLKKVRSWRKYIVNIGIMKGLTQITLHKEVIQSAICTTIPCFVFLFEHFWGVVSDLFRA